MIAARLSITSFVAMTCLAALPARAGSLWWTKIEVHATSEPKCMQLAYGVAAQGMLQGVRRSNAEVAGTRAQVYVSITCIGRGSAPAIAVVMAMGNDDQSTRRVRDEIAQRLQGTTSID
jgi:hypothetical protein